MFASILSSTNVPIYELGPLPCADSIRTVADDVAGSHRQVFLCFVLSVALAKPMAGCEIIFEKSFAPIHMDLWFSRLPHTKLRFYLREVPTGSQVVATVGHLPPPKNGRRACLCVWKA